MPATTLVPGYKQVESFGPDNDYLEDEDEVSYITLDLGVVEPTLLPSTSTYRLIQTKGLDTPTPFLQLSGSIFKGRHDTLLGTELLFTEEKNDAQPNKRSLVYVGCTEQRIRFKEVQLKEKVRSDPTPSERKEQDLFEEVASMYVDMDADQNPPQAPPAAGPVEESRVDGVTGTATKRKRKKGSRKGKERAVDMNDDAMDMT